MHQAVKTRQDLLDCVTVLRGLKSTSSREEIEDAIQWADEQIKRLQAVDSTPVDQIPALEYYIRNAKDLLDHK